MVYEPLHHDLQKMANVCVIFGAFLFLLLSSSVLYYIKVSGIASGNKLIKTIRYIDDFGDIRFVSYIVLKFVGVSSKHLRVYLESLRQSSAIFGHLRKLLEILGKCSETFVWSSGQFWKIFGNLRKVVGNLRKIIKNAVISTFM